jgi:glycerol-3-phosphate dehydrogenase
MWQGNWRDKIWAQLDQPWDIVVIGGGITGAGILREGTRLGLKTLLVEQRDFAWGTSSRSSKMVHGGLRYLQEGKPLLTRSLVRERKRLLAEGRGLIDPLGFLLAIYKGDFPGRWTYAFGLSIYDLMALKWKHRYYDTTDFQMLAPHIALDGLKGGYSYSDAQTDDARLVLRIIREAVAEGGVAISYMPAEELLSQDGRVVGVRLWDGLRSRRTEVHARVVINATGPWVDRLRGQVGAKARIRPLRGGHLIFPSWRLPVAQAVSTLHPVDQRYMYILPWEGITIVGTTDTDHEQPLDDEPTISSSEVAYLMAAVEALFPSLALTLDDVVSTFAGVRAVIGTGKAQPSKESRDHVVWEENGLLTVTGGKLTNFRLVALDALRAVRHRLSDLPALDRDNPVFNPVKMDLPDAEHLDEAACRRLLGRYGKDASAIVAAAKPGDLEPIPGTQVLWAELRWVAHNEGVVHLDDLLLRRVRLGLLLPQGGEALLPKIRAICQPELGWDDARWEAEEAAYQALWRRCYSLPDPKKITDC